MIEKQRFLKNQFNQYFLVSLSTYSICGVFFHFKDLSNDTNLLQGIASHPFDALRGESSDPQMPPFLGIALFPAHLMSSLGVSFLSSFRILLYLYSLVAVFVINKIDFSNLSFRYAMLIRFSIYINLVVLVFILTQEDVLGYVFILLAIFYVSRGHLNKALVSIVVASLVAKILFMFFIFPLGYQLLRNEESKKLRTFFICFTSPFIWIFGILQSIKNGNPTVLDFKLPLFYSANAWSFLSSFTFLSEKFLRASSVALLGIGLVFTLMAVRKSVPTYSWFALSSVWILVASYQIQPEYLFFALPITLMLSEVKFTYFSFFLFPIAFIENVLLMFAERNSTTSISTGKGDLVAKVLQFVPQLNSNLPSYFFAICFSTLSFGLLLHSYRELRKTKTNQSNL